MFPLKSSRVSRFSLNVLRAQSQLIGTSGQASAVRDTSSALTCILSPADWETVLEVPWRFKPCVWKLLKNATTSVTVPTAVNERLRLCYLFNSVRAEIASRMVVELSERFECMQIQFVFIKGAMLMHTVYQNDIGVRAMVDIDLLVAVSDYEATCLALEEQGFRAMGPSDVRGQGYIREPRGINLRVSIHHALTEPLDLYHVDSRLLTELLQTPWFFEAKGARVQGLRPDAEIFYQCVHNSKHLTLRTPKSEWYARLLDLWGLIRFYSSSIDWSRFAWLASQNNSLRWAIFNLAAAELLFGSVLLDEARTYLKDATVERAIHLLRTILGEEARYHVKAIYVLCFFRSRLTRKALLAARRLGIG